MGPIPTSVVPNGSTPNPEAMTISRRRFLRSAAAISLGFSGLRCANADSVLSPGPGVGFGPLADDPEGLLALPEGFRYTVISRRGERMTDGFLVPGLHDGMAAFPGPGGHTLLVRNHEVNSGADPGQGAFGGAQRAARPTGS